VQLDQPGGCAPIAVHTAQAMSEMHSFWRRAAGWGGAGFSQHGPVRPQTADPGAFQVGWRQAGSMAAA
jgi:hypothetical protein